MVTHTPVSFWLDMDLDELFEWIEELQALMREMKSADKNSGNLLAGTRF